MYNNDSDSLNAGAYANLPQQDIRLSGDHHPTNTQQNSGIMAAAPQTYTQRRRAQMGGRINYAHGGLKNIKGQDHMLAYITPDEANSLQAMGGQETMTPEGIPAYPPPGERGGPGSGAEGRSPGGGGGGGGGEAAMAANIAAAAARSRAAAAQAVVDSAVKQAAATPADNDIEADPGQLGYKEFTPTDTKTIADKAMDFYKNLPTPLNILTNYLGDKPVNQYEGITGEDALGGGDYVQYTDVRDFSQGEFGTDYSGLDNEEKSVIDKAFYDFGGLSDSARDIGLPSSQMEALYSGPTTTAPTGTGEYIPPLMSDLVSTTTPVDSAVDSGGATFASQVADQKAANLAAKAEMPFKDYYVGGDPTAEQTAFMKASGAAPSTVGLEQYAAHGGRIGYDRGGIAGIRQPYFIGKLVKKVTGGAKKLLKSDALKAAALAALTFKMGGGNFTGGGNFKFGNLLTDRNLLGLGTLATLSPFLMKQKEEENLEKYGVHRGEGIDSQGIRKKIAEGNLDRSEFAFMPGSYYAAEGGRIGLAKGLSPRIAALRAMQGLNDDDEDNKKLFAAQKKAQGGRIGYADKGFVEGDTPEVLGPVTPGKGLGDIDEGDFNLSDLGEYTQMYPSKDKDKANLIKLIEKLIQLGSPPARAIEIAKQLIKKGMAQGESEGIASLREGRNMPGTPGIPERKFPKPFEIKIPDNFNPDKGFYTGKPKLSPDATQIPHHLDINPLRTMEFRDRNGNGIEDRAEGIYAEDRDLIPFDPDREKKLLAEQFEKYFPDPDKEFAQGGRIGAEEGGLMDLGGMEKDYRQEGGFVPIGGKEKADDVPARLSKNEFVFTADAVRAAGGGDIDQGAEVMENVMNNLEAGGEVSEDSQGLEGARGMFANTQQLEKRII